MHRGIRALNESISSGGSTGQLTSRLGQRPGSVGHSRFEFLSWGDAPGFEYTGPGALPRADPRRLWGKISRTMKPKPPRPGAAAGLRRRAEASWKKRQADSAPPRAGADPHRLVHELEVHQIELETQNAELERAREETEVALERYTELYDFAPVGYFSIDRQGLIQEANLTGAAMFGVARSRLLRRRLQSFVAPSSGPVIDTFLRTVFARAGKHACEALLLTVTGATFWGDLQASVAVLPGGERKWCRLAVSDIAALKRGQEAQRRVVSLAAAIESANAEIARRRAAEASLKASEQTQRQLLETSRALHEQLRRLTHQILLVQEEERKQISRQLHDVIAQVLAGICVQLAALNETAVDPRGLRQRIERTRRLVKRSIHLVHRFARDLRPTMLDDLGLIPALRSYVREFAAPKGLRIHFTAMADVSALDGAKRTVVYRVTQEALVNVARHAHARNATVRLLGIPGAVRLEIHDDGKSFPAERILAAKRGGRLGLLGMRERVEMVGGRFAIASAPGKGTTVTAEIPIAKPPV
jgi:PAS domain S-box-containing protein